MNFITRIITANNQSITKPKLSLAQLSPNAFSQHVQLLNISEIMVFNPKRLENIVARLVFRRCGVFPSILPKPIIRHLREEMCYGGSFHELLLANAAIPAQFRTITVEPNYRGVVITFSANEIGIVNVTEATIVAPFERKALLEREKNILFGFPTEATAYSHVCVNPDCTTITLSAIWKRKRAMIKLKIRKGFKNWGRRGFVHCPSFSSFLVPENSLTLICLG